MVKHVIAHTNEAHVGKQVKYQLGEHTFYQKDIQHVSGKHSSTLLCLLNTFRMSRCVCCMLRYASLCMHNTHSRTPRDDNEAGTLLLEVGVW